jgi:hypothetical protein
LTDPPILTQLSEPGSFAKPAPNSAHGTVDFFVASGCDDSIGLLSLLKSGGSASAVPVIQAITPAIAIKRAIIQPHIVLRNSFSLFELDNETEQYREGL